MRRAVLLALSFAVVGSVACGKGTKPNPPALSPAVDVAELVGPEVAPDAPVYQDAQEADAAFDGTNYLVVWTHRTATGDDVYGTRVSASGEILDPAGFVISAGTTNETAPAVAFDGTNYLVVWQDHRLGSGNIFAARVAPSGTVLDPNGFPLDTDADQQRTPAVAFDGTNYLVAWSDRRSGLKWDIYGVRVAPGGAVLDANALVIASVNNQQFSPAIAFDGTNHLVVWADRRTSVPEVFGTRITPGGLVLDPAGIAISNGPSNVQSSPSVAFDGTNVTVVWQDIRNSAQADVYAARVTPAGTVLDTSAIAVASGSDAQRLPAVAADGRYLLVAWVRGDALAPTDVQGVRLDGSGTVLDSPAFPIAESTHVRSVALASDRTGRVLALYDVVDAAGAARLRARIVTNWATLAVAKSGRGAGTVSSSPEGIDCGGTCSAPFDAGTTVTLTAAPDGDSVFGGWSGACTGTDPCVVSIDQAKSVTATFLPLYAVTVTMADATPGTVTSVPAGISCTSGTCSARFVEGTQLQLVPHGVPGASVFGSWSDTCPAGQMCPMIVTCPVQGAPCTFTVQGPTSLTAKFLPAVTITLLRFGTAPGAMTIGGFSCTDASCGVDVAKGSNVAITGSPGAGAVLKVWTGCTSSFETSCSLTAVTSPRTVTARFEPSAFTVTAAPTGSGAGTISGGGLACTTGNDQGCTANVDNPPFTTSYPTFTLRATPSANSVFKSWTGCAAVSGDPSACTLTVTADKSVSAKFETSTLPLTASTTGMGVGTISGGGLACTTGSPAGCMAAVPNPSNSTAYETVTLRATPQDGSVFKSWTGCIAVAGDPSACTVLMSMAKSVSAKFEPSTIPLTATTTGTGVGTISGGGLACTSGSLAGCTAAVPNPANSYAYNTVTLRATPQDGSVFKSWTGCTAVAGDPSACTVIMSVAKSVSAKFEPSTIPLTASTIGTGSGTISGGGLACTTGSSAGCTAAVPNPANSTAYLTVTLRATPQDGSVFKSWIGCTAAAGDPSACTVLVSMARAVTAKFETSTITLTASTTGTGVGTISGAGLACTTGSTAGCTAEVPNPANSTAYNTVTLRATPDAGSVFKSWIGCTAVAGDPSACTIAVTMAKSVSAKFEPSTLPVTITSLGGGAGTVTVAGVSCTVDSTNGCTAAVANPGNTSAYNTVTLTASPDAAFVFRGWIGCTAVAGDPSSCTLVVDGAKSVSAKFEPSILTLNVTLVGAGTVSGGGIDCASGSSSGCSATAPNGATVVLTATPAPGYIFKSWSAGCTSTADNVCTVTMNSVKTITATFQPATYPLEISFAGMGSGTVTAGDVTCPSSAGVCTIAEPNGSTIVLTAAADPGSTFAGWSGVCSGTGECRVTMFTARYIRATFLSP
jgi:hypothetical protein